MRCLACGHEVVELVGRADYLGLKMYRCPECEDTYYEDPPGVLRSTASRR